MYASFNVQLAAIREKYAVLEAEYKAMREDNKKKITHYMDNVVGRRVDLLHRQIVSFDASLKNNHPVSNILYVFPRLGLLIPYPFEERHARYNQSLCVWIDAAQSMMIIMIFKLSVMANDGQHFHDFTSISNTVVFF